MKKRLTDEGKRWLAKVGMPAKCQHYILKSTSFPMRYGIHLKVSGDYALFSRPEMKVERFSYDVMTTAAADDPNAFML